jgi:hypothetical protein
MDAFGGLLRAILGCQARLQAAAGRGGRQARLARPPRRIRQHEQARRTRAGERRTQAALQHAVGHPGRQLRAVAAVVAARDACDILVVEGDVLRGAQAGRAQQAQAREERHGSAPRARHVSAPAADGRGEHVALRSSHARTGGASNGDGDTRSRAQYSARGAGHGAGWRTPAGAPSDVYYCVASVPSGAAVPDTRAGLRWPRAAGSLEAWGGL